MRRRLLLLSVAIPVGLVGGGIWLYGALNRTVPSRRRLVDAGFLALEQRLGYPLYAPTWVPMGVSSTPNGSTLGKFRVLTTYGGPDNDCLLIVAQEPRGGEREAYHQRLIRRCRDAVARVGERDAYFCYGEMGERRLIWCTADAWLIISSGVLPDTDLLRIASSMTRGEG